MKDKEVFGKQILDKIYTLSNSVQCNQSIENDCR